MKMPLKPADFLQKEKVELENTFVNFILIYLSKLLYAGEELKASAKIKIFHINSGRIVLFCLVRCKKNLSDFYEGDGLKLPSSLLRTQEQ